MAKTQKPPVINVHAHTFTHAHVPPLLARKILPFPLYWLLHLGFILVIYLKIVAIKNKYYTRWHRLYRRIVYRVNMFVQRLFILRAVHWIILTWLIIITVLFTFDFLAWIAASSFSEDNPFVKAIRYLDMLFEKYRLIPEWITTFYKILITLFVLVFVKSGRNLILFIFKKIFSFFKVLPGKTTQKLLERYLYIIKYSVYKTQTRVFAKMKDQYPKGSGFGILPMDMDYMGAGTAKKSYQDQLAEIAKYKNSTTYADEGTGIYPFVFVDSRRIRDDQKPNQKRPKKEQLFNYHLDGQTVVLDDCLIKTYVEGENFSGFKIYPAIGYYPFEKELLPVWKYAADNNLPIVTHCIKGVVFYRGTKEKQWDTHPVFMDEDVENTLLLPERKNVDFQLNFTHPMNYLCLLEEPFLKKLLHQYQDDDLNTLFGFTGLDKPLTANLSNLKINLAHYGGEDQWKKYLNTDRDPFGQQINKQPGQGIKFVKYDKKTKALRYTRLAKMWKYTDWYSIICSMMMRYENVYADISYIIHDQEIFPLLKESLKPIHGKLRDRILYGTDFYVVRNHDSDKGIYVESKGFLTDDEFDLIARYNTRDFLNLPPFTP